MQKLWKYVLNAGLALYMLWALYGFIAPGLQGHRPLAASLGWVAGLLACFGLPWIAPRTKNPWLQSLINGMYFACLTTVLDISIAWRGTESIHTGKILGHAVFSLLWWTLWDRYFLSRTRKHESQ